MSVTLEQARPSLFVEDSAAVPEEKVPSWRGVSHEKAFALAPAMALLLACSADGAGAQLAALIFGTTMTAMLGVSAMNHRATVGLRWRPWLRRADHATINFFLAGTSTALAIVTLSNPARGGLIALVWLAAVVASLVTVLWVDVPGWIPASMALASGWSAAVTFLRAATLVDPAAVALFVLGGISYTCGALVYALRRPELHRSFGYHELFHALVLAGVVCHYLMLALFVLPLGD